MKYASFSTFLLAIYVYNFYNSYFTFYRKGYAVAAAGGAALGGGRGGAAGQSNMMMILKKEGDESAPKSPWVPDSVTGYYRPENQENQIDAVELRRMLLKSNIRGH